MIKKIYPYISKKRFYNFPGEHHRSILLHSFSILLYSWFQKLKGNHTLSGWDVQSNALFHVPEDHSSGHHITCIGHASFVIQSLGITVITDPVFGSSSPLVQRLTKPGVLVEQLPKIDVVLISHNHRDHMDEKSLLSIKKANPDVRVLVPLGDKKWFDKRGFAHVSEAMWWEKFEVQATHNATKKMELTFLPAHHWSQRGLLDYNTSLWGSWMIQSEGVHTYFAGDTAYGQHFKVIAQEFPHIDVALMPIGPCEPREWMRFTHMNAEEAGQAFLDLCARFFVPMHWGVYWFGTEHPLLPIERLNIWWEKNKKMLADKMLHLIKFGQTVTMKLYFTAHHHESALSASFTTSSLR